jgi:hypothetical protein
MENAEAMEHLAQAMNRLADKIEEFQDPLWWQKTVGASFQTMLNAPVVQGLVGASFPRIAPQLESIVVKLSEDDREEMSKRVMKALKPQLKDFNKFVKVSLEELPPNRLKQLAQEIDAGHIPKLERRRGCVFVKMDSGSDFHLNL